VIEDRDVEQVARLARLALSDEERGRIREELSAILQYVDKLRQLDVEGVEPTSHAVPLLDVMRDDEVRPGLSPGDALANAPEAAGDLFRVPRIIED
jgi:aspartyl-tRNA(Asn)/glutamyl-tRNA(Gln) amidotransferase subunit C